MIALLKWLLIFAATGYLGCAGLLFFAQRSLLFSPERARTAPGDADLPQAQEIVLDTPDGQHVIVWHVPPRDNKPVVIYFHGNGGSLRGRAARFGALTADGTGLVALSYRGFGGSTGSPSEQGMMLDAAAAYAFATSRYDSQRIVLWGESLGTNVAIALAAAHPVARVLLESPHTSVSDVAASIYWMFPVRWLIRDPFRSDLIVSKITAPVLVVHGEQDTVVPIRFGEQLYALITAPKRFIRMPGANHNDHDQFGMLEQVRPFIEGTH